MELKIFDIELIVIHYRRFKMKFLNINLISYIFFVDNFFSLIIKNHEKISK